MSNDARADLTGTTIADGKFRLLRLLGEGGGGQVYLGEQTALGKQVAIKLLAPEYASDELIVRRFLREARAAARVQHENVIQIFDFGSTGTGTAYISMEYLEGEDLGTLLEREGELPWARVKPLMLQICRALHSAHGQGVVHRDMKPENCLRVRSRRNEDTLKLLDFGLAKVFGDEAQPQQALSSTGKIFGTPEYMSPEQCRGDQADDRSDVYAVGVMLFELLTGAVPFSSSNSFMDTLVMHLENPVPAVTSRVPLGPEGPQLDAIVRTAMAKDPADRYSSMRDLAEALLAVDGGATVDRSPSSDVDTGLLLKMSLALNVVLAAALLWALLG